MTECIHGLAPADCWFCSGRGEPAPEVHDKSALGDSFDARYPGSCGWCGEWFSEGEPIRPDHANGAYVCQGCFR